MYSILYNIYNVALSHGCAQPRLRKTIVAHIGCAHLGLRTTLAVHNRGCGKPICRGHQFRHKYKYLFLYIYILINSYIY